MGVSLKTEQRRSHGPVSSFGRWVRRAEGYRGTRQLKPFMEVPVKPWSPLAPPKAGKPRRPPWLPLICEFFPDQSSFSVFRETPMASAIHFKELNCYESVYFEPTALRMKTPGNASSNRWIAFQPVQCMGTTTLGPMAFMASMVSPMIGSKNGPAR